MVEEYAAQTACCFWVSAAEAGTWVLSHSCKPGIRCTLPKLPAYGGFTALEAEADASDKLDAQ